MCGSNWKQWVMVVWNICLQMGQKEKKVADQSLGKRWNLLAWLQDKRIGSPNPPPLVVSQIITRVMLWPRACQHHIMCETRSLHAFSLALIYSPSTATLHGRTPHPTPLCGFYSKHMLRTFEVPAIPWLSFFFPFRVFKGKPTKSKILWILPSYNLWRCITAYPSIIKSYAIKILHMSFWREKDVLFFFFPFLVLQETYPHFRNTKLVYIEAQIRHLKSLHFPTTDNWRNHWVFIASHTGLVESLVCSCLTELAKAEERNGP